MSKHVTTNCDMLSTPKRSGVKYCFVEYDGTYQKMYEQACEGDNGGGRSAVTVGTILFYKRLCCSGSSGQLIIYAISKFTPRL